MSQQVKKSVTDLFVEGARQGWTVGTQSMLPNILMAFVLIEILNVTGLLTIIGKVAAPIMALWGLPGEGLVVLCTSFLAMAGGAGAAIALAGNGVLTPTHVTILAPAIMLMGAMIQYMGRCLGTAEANRRYWGWHILVCIMNACIGMWLMRLIVLFF